MRSSDFPHRLHITSKIPQWPAVVSDRAGSRFQRRIIMAGQAFGVSGLEVMGRNIALNIERNGFPIAVFNRTYSKTQAFLEGPARGKNAKGAERIEDFVKLLTRSRRVLMM